MLQPQQLLVQQLTANGRGAVASLRLRGNLDRLEVPKPLFSAANKKPINAQPLNRIIFGHWGLEDREEIVVCRTAETTLELHCHGGHAAVRRILDDLQSRDTPVGTSGWTPSEGQSVFDHEMAVAITKARTLRTATIVQRQRNGTLHASLTELIRMANPVDHDTLKSELELLIDRSTFGLRLTSAWNVVIAGRPNVGKSSLINALVGFERSIVFDQPGTTRDIVSTETAMDGWPISLSDTAGIRTNAEELEAAGIDLAKQRLTSADLQIVLLDVSQSNHPDDTRLLADCPNALVVAHKADLPAVNSTIPAAAVHVSSVTRDGLDRLMAEIVGRLVPTSPHDNAAIPVTARQAALLEQSLVCVNEGDIQSAVQLITSILYDED